MKHTPQDKIIYFPEHIVRYTGLPSRFTFPFHYEPHPLAKIAADGLQNYLGANLNMLTGDAPGKMFGVLVVADSAGKVGYVSAFSGKLAGTNDHEHFVPPVFDMLTENSFFLQGLKVIDAINREVKELLADERYQSLASDMEQFSASSQKEIAALKQQLKDNKERRRQQREGQKSALGAPDYALLEAEMVAQSQYDKRQLKMLTEKWAGLMDNTRAQLNTYTSRIEKLGNERRQLSNELQGRIFEQYVFLNAAGESKSLQDIFSLTPYGKPPSAAGECATPKLLQYAFTHGYRPLAMAEFWWGASPESEIRKHGQFYPACTGRCGPILGHMLQGMAVDDNPLLQPAIHGAELAIVYEDDYLLVVNKPAGLLSVPGIGVYDSVYSRMKAYLVHIEPLPVHRLDMATSGLLVVAKTPEVYKALQKQFLTRAVSKRYTALLSRAVAGDEGEIKLPLRVDFYNRPQQIVCFEQGKKSTTRWKVVERTGELTRVHFWPVTGRTHQLRVHAAHPQGLNAPIAGDELYGTAAARLYLHAAFLSFIHPATNERVSFEVEADF